MVFWLVSLPLVDNLKERTWSTLQQKTTYDNEWSSNFKFDLPELRVGTLDSLMQLSDDLVKTSVTLDGIVGKIRRTIVDVCGSPAGAMQIDNRPVESYLTGFRWDEAKYPSRRSLQEIVAKIQEEMMKLDDELKVSFGACFGALACCHNHTCIWLPPPLQRSPGYMWRPPNVGGTANKRRHAYAHILWFV